MRSHSPDGIPHRPPSSHFPHNRYSEPLRELVKKAARVEVLRAAAIHEGMRTLRMDGVRKIFDGLTDLEQITRVCL